MQMLHMSDSGSILKTIRSPSISGQPPVGGQPPPLVPPVGAPPAGASPVVPPQPAQPNNRLFDTHNISGLPTAPRKKGFFSRLRGLWVACPDMDNILSLLLYYNTNIANEPYLFKFCWHVLDMEGFHITCSKLLCWLYFCTRESLNGASTISWK